MQTPARRKVLVTGAEGSLGRSVVARFLRGGDTILATCSPNASPASLAGVEWIKVDLTDRNQVDSLLSKRDDVSVVVHCAGGFRWGKIDAYPSEDLEFLLKLNFQSAFFIASAASRGMKKRKEGVLLFISSKATLVPAAGMSGYAASKAAVNALVQSLAEELKEEGVRVNAVLPSVIDTPPNRKDMPDADFSKWVTTEELAEVLYDLSLPKSKSISGALVPVYGRT